jgi:hypothetical protein
MEDVGIILWTFGLFAVIWSILLTFGIFCGHFVNIFTFWYVVRRKIWQPCITCVGSRDAGSSGNVAIL